jgi:hypothetical protein
LSLSNLSLTNIGTIDEAEKIEQGDGGNDVQIDLPAKPGFVHWVKMHERVTISGTAMSKGVGKVKVNIHLSVAA